MTARTSAPDADPSDSGPMPAVADAPAGNWVDRFAPAFARPYLRLARMDRPIGTWLLLFPCWWSLALAEVAEGHPYPSLVSLSLFALGALVMRGAGCAYNDFVDHEYDAKVARTASRPIPSGQVTPDAALVFACVLAFAGFLVLIWFNTYTVVLGIASLGIVAVYPFMKRFTYWPQAVLGLAFNWGALVGWASVKGSLALPPLLLYVGSVLWTIGYDTIYAHQDTEDDLMLGLKSTALTFGERTPAWVGGFYAGARRPADGLAGVEPRHPRSRELPAPLPFEPRRRRRDLPRPRHRHAAVVVGRIELKEARRRRRFTPWRPYPRSPLPLRPRPRPKAS
jgi:4-hydroxybenzoate polyprenyltransferase